MKKRLLVGLVFLAMVIGAHAQTHFSQLLGNSLTLHSGFASARMSDGHFVTVGINPSNGFRVNELDAGGLLLSTRDINFSGTIKYIFTAIESAPGELLVTGKGVNFSSYDVFFVAKIKLSPGFSISATQYIETSSYTQGAKISKSGNSVYAVFPQIGFFDVHKIDYSSMNDIWSKSIRCDTVNNKNPATACDMSDSGIVVIGKCDSIPGWCDLDTNGTVDTFKLFSINGYTRIYDLTRAVDGNYLMVGLHATSHSTVNTSPVIAKVSPGGTVLWATILDEATPADTIARFVQVKEMPDGRIAAFATNWESFADTYFNAVCFFDQSGNLLTSHQLGSFVVSGSPDLFYELYDVEIYPDGILMSGLAVNVMSLTAKNMVIFTSLDFSDVCQQGPLNPVPTVFNTGPVTHYGTDHIREEDGVASNTGFIGATTTVTNPVPDFMCGISLQADEVVSLNEPTIYPNPAHGQVNIVFADEPGTHSYSLVDVHGHIMYRETTNSQLVQISTLSLPAGLYIFREEGKRPSNTKILVE